MLGMQKPVYTSLMSSHNPRAPDTLIRPKEILESYGGWAMLGMFAGILVWEEAWDLPHSGALSAALLLLITTGAVVSSLTFEKRMWCRWEGVPRSVLRSTGAPESGARWAARSSAEQGCAPAFGAGASWRRACRSRPAADGACPARPGLATCRPLAHAGSSAPLAA